MPGPLLDPAGGAVTTATSRAGLPVTLSRFIGRQAEIAELVDLIAERRLVTITGAGGCGKTRLAAEALSTIARRWPDGAGWIDLTPVADPSRVGEVAAAAMGVLVGPTVGAHAALIDRLRDRRMVIGIDNCEHLLAACGELVESLLHACPEMSVLTTSREPLGIAGETVWRVPSMAENEVIELFADRAQSVLTGFVTDSTNEEAVRTVCRRLDGIPLAVELAAAWVRILTPAQISVALDDRFRLLVGGPHRELARQQTLAASVEWSYGLLRDDARTLLRRLAVFAGGFTLESAEAVCAGGSLPRAQVLDALRRLVDGSMCTVEDRDGASRFRLLKTIREYAADRLADAGESENRRDQHLDHFLAVAESARMALDHLDQDVVFAALEAEHDNVRAALEWGLSHAEPERGRQLAAALVRLWFAHGHAHEGIRWLQRAVDLTPEDRSSLQAELLSGLSLVAIPAGRLDLIDDASRTAIDIGTTSGDDRILGLAYASAMYVPFFVDLARAQELAQVAQRHAAAAGDVFATDVAQVCEAYTLTNRGRHDEAVAIARPVFERTMPRHDRVWASFARGVEIWPAVHGGDLRSAVAVASEVVEISRPLNDYYAVGTNIANLAWVHGLAGDVQQGLRLLSSVFRSIDNAGPDVDVVAFDAWNGWLHLWAGDVDRAVAWFERATRYLEPFLDNWTVGRALPGLAAARRHQGRVIEATAAAERGAVLARRLDDPHSLAEALEELGHLAEEDDPARAEDLHHEALQLRVDYRLRTYFVDSLDALARIAVRGGRPADGARVLAASNAARTQMGYPHPTIDEDDHDAVVEEARSALGEEFDDVWSKGGQLSLDEAVAYVSRSRGTRQRPSSGWASLTPTELEVVALVAEGLTNPQIAERLFVSRATVKTHLSHVYTKVGVANRAELASLATRRQRGDDDR